MVVFLYTNDHYEHLFNLQAADFDRPHRCVSGIKMSSVAHNALPEIYMTYMYRL